MIKSINLDWLKFCRPNQICPGQYASKYDKLDPLSFIRYLIVLSPNLITHLIPKYCANINKFKLF
jgi:hypothetical protein